MSVTASGSLPERSSCNKRRHRPWGHTKSGKRAVRRPRGGQVPVKRRGRNAESIGDIGDSDSRLARSVLATSRSSSVILGGRPPVRPTRFAAASPLERAPNESALKLRKRAEHVKHQDALRRRRVYRCRASAAPFLHRVVDGLETALAARTGRAAFLATCTNRALLGPVGHRASLPHHI